MAGHLHAGDFATWLQQIEGALAGGVSDVPCGDCSGCCTSSQFVHIGPDETDALAHIPDRYLTPAPGATDGTVLLGFDERGHCPMLRDGRCSIYDYRPRTCRRYDCRVFAATEVVPDKPDIAARVERWRFAGESSPDRRALHRAARWLEDHRESLLITGAVSDPTRLAVSAIRLRRHFTDSEPTVEEAIDHLTTD